MEVYGRLLKHGHQVGLVLRDAMSFAGKASFVVPGLVTSKRQDMFEAEKMCPLKVSVPHFSGPLINTHILSSHLVFGSSS